MTFSISRLITKKEGIVLFNDTLNTFYLWLYGIRHVVKDHSDSERGNLLPPHGLLFQISSKGSFICTIRQTGYHSPCYVTDKSTSTEGIRTMDPQFECPSTQIAREETRFRHIGYSFCLATRLFYVHHPTDRIIHTTAFYLHQLWSTGWNEK